MLTGEWGKFYDAAEAMTIFITSQQLLNQTVDVLAMLHSRFFGRSSSAFAGTAKVYENAIADVNGASIHCASKDLCSLSKHPPTCKMLSRSLR